MLFRHEDIVQALAGGDINDPKYFAAVYQKLVLDRPDDADKRAALQTNGKDPSDYPRQFELFLTEDLPSSQSVPSLVAVWKIVFKLILFAATYEIVIRDFFWWDIEAKQRALIATLIREGYEFRVYFYWKKTNKGEVHPMHRGAKVTCSTSPHAPGGLVLVFDAQAYEEMREAYTRWLKTPLVLPADFKPNKAESVSAMPINTLAIPANC
ncbi:MAG: hypothetical protein PHW33_02690 [Candidatus Portnoybacteria bacterium]|jgi:hypothetical protein|nr:hypothetical protein [Candidatus Portnoybacteria bacterium]MDD5437639.1 hypothetical protein [Patescibacteria group bacterium]